MTVWALDEPEGRELITLHNQLQDFHGQRFAENLNNGILSIFSVGPLPPHPLTYLTLAAASDSPFIRITKHGLTAPTRRC